MVSSRQRQHMNFFLTKVNKNSIILTFEIHFLFDTHINTDKNKKYLRNVSKKVAWQRYWNLSHKVEEDVM